MTSGNRRDEPIAIDDGDALARLHGDRRRLSRSRPSHPGAMRRLDRAGRTGGARRSCGARGATCRSRSRCHAGSGRPTLAVGGQLKNVFALVRDRDAFLSQHLGDLGTSAHGGRGSEWFEHFERLLELEPAVVAHDLHPEYRSTAYALSRAGVDRVGVQHHHAHIASCLADNGVDARGDRRRVGRHRLRPRRQRVWGGEFLVADLDGFERGRSPRVRAAAGRRGGGPRALAHGGRRSCAPRTVRPCTGSTSTSCAGWTGGMADSHGGHRARSERAAHVERGPAVRCGRQPARSSRPVEFEAQAAMELEACARAEPGRLYPTGILGSRTQARRAHAGPDPRGGRGSARRRGRAARSPARFHASLAAVIADAVRGSGSGPGWAASR